MREKILEILKEEDHISGEAISRRLGVSRAAVHKHVVALRALGYPIESTPGSGYSLHPVELINQLELDRMLAAIRPGIKGIFLESVDSTNNLAKSLGEESVIVALRQTAGRGRRGRSWISESAQGLYFSLLLKPSAKPSIISPITQVAALALARVLSDNAKIKWPNDIFLGGRKVSGILSELVSEADAIEKLIIGIGVNFKPVEGLSDIATSLQEEYVSLSMKALLEAFLKEFYPLYDEYLITQHLGNHLEELKARSLLLGEQVSILGDETRWIFADLLSSGEALLRSVEEEKVIGYGEISLRKVSS